LAWKGWAELLIGDTEKVKATLSEGRRVAGSRLEVWTSFLAAKLGEPENAQRLLSQFNEKAKKEYVPPDWFFWLNYAIGNADNTFRWLVTDFEEHGPLVRFSHMPGMFPHLREDPRWDKAMALLESMEIWPK
jgi:hypothetical protein